MSAFLNTSNILNCGENHSLTLTSTVNRYLPDKAIDLVDEAAARVKMEVALKPEVCVCGALVLQPGATAWCHNLVLQPGVTACRSSAHARGEQEDAAVCVWGGYGGGA